MKAVCSPALYILVGPSGAGKSTWARNVDNVPNQKAIISSDELRFELLGDRSRQDKNNVVFDEFHHRIASRLKAGQYAIADATHLKLRDLRKTQQIAQDLSVPIYHLIFNRPLEEKLKNIGGHTKDFVIRRHQVTFESNLTELLKQENLVDMRGEVIDSLKFRIPQRFFDVAQKGKTWYRIIGDVHGEYDQLKAILNPADESYPIFLGDIIDAGPESVKTLNFVSNLVQTGQAMSLVGNHEHKILRVLDAGGPEFFKGTISDYYRGFLDEYANLNEDEQKHAHKQLRALYEMSPLWLNLSTSKEKYVLVHGAFNLSMYNNHAMRTTNKMLMALALYGSVESQRNSMGMPIRNQEWVKEIPAGVMAIVGHQILSTEKPVIKINAIGGKAMFLDTGAGKGGKLSYYDIESEAS